MLLPLLSWWTSTQSMQQQKTLIPAHHIPDRRLGSYDFGNLLAKGTYGDIYACRDQTVVKVMDRREECVYEVEMHTKAAEIFPSFLVPLVDCGEEEVELEDGKKVDYYFIVYGRVHGCFGDMNEQHKQHAYKVFNMFGVCWARGIFHLDVKSANVLVTDDNRMYLHDWGVACIWEEDKSEFYEFNFQEFLLHIPSEMQDQGVTILSPLMQFITENVLDRHAASDPRLVMEWLSLISFRSLFGFWFPHVRFNRSGFPRLFEMDEQLRKASVIHHYGYADWEPIFTAIACVVNNLPPIAQAT